MKKVICNLIFLIILCSCQKDREMNSIYPVEERVIISDLSYGSDRQQKLDLFLPANRDDATRLLVFIHGGGWNKGDKKDFFHIPLMLSDSGIATASVNYRLADTSAGVTYHDILGDIEKAILFLQSRDSLYNCPFDTIVLIGKSAGGHLALMYAYQRTTISKVIALATPTDLNDPNLLGAGEMHACVNNMISSDDAYLRTLASPIHYNDSVATRLYHGKKDLLVSYNQSVVFYDKIKTFNPENSLVLFENAEHEILDDDLNQIIRETIQWVKK